MPPPFLTARWEDLALLNYSCPVKVLEPLGPLEATTLGIRGRRIQRVGARWAAPLAVDARFLP